MTYTFEKDEYVRFGLSTHWSLHAIWAQSFKSGETRLSKQTWYHYNKLMRFRVNSKKGKRPKRIPLRASCVNEIWHADITVFKTLDGVKHYIYTVMDNYSRFIHAWHIDTVVSAEICRNTLHQGLKNAFDQQPVVLQQLVTDGGPENDNFTVKNFLNENGVKHSTALRDIAQSNSMMEAFYSTAKYRYLYQQKIENGTELKEVFEKFLDEYHYKKPHYALGIYTPSEVLLGQNKLYPPDQPHLA